MQFPRNQRRDPRYALNHGNVILQSESLPPLACPLVDLSAGGCRCVVPLEKLEPDQALNWASAIESGTPLQAGISVPPHTEGLLVEAEVREIYPNPEQSAIGLHFPKLDTLQTQRLKETLQSILPKKPHADAATGDTAVVDGKPYQPDYFSGRPNALQRIKRSTRKWIRRNKITNLLKDLRSQARKLLRGKKPSTRKSLVVPVKEQKRSGQHLGDILVLQRKITSADLAKALKAKRPSKEKFGRYLTRVGLVHPLDICSALSTQYGLPVVDLRECTITRSISDTFTYLTKLRHNFVPFEATPYQVKIAVSEPLSDKVLTDLEQRSHKEVKIFLAEDDEIQRVLHSLRPAEQRKVRKSCRYKVGLPVAFRFCDVNGDFLDDVGHEGRTVNISEHGMTIIPADDVTGRGEYIRLSVLLPDDQIEGFYAFKHIRHNAAEEGQAAHTELGLQLLEMDEALRQRLKEVCVHLNLAVHKHRNPKPNRGIRGAKQYQTA